MQDRATRRTKLIIGSTLTLALTVTGVTPAQASPNAHISLADTHHQQLMSDQQLNELIDLLGSLPEDIKNADPKTTPNYEKRLTDALAIAQNKRHPGVTTYANWLACTVAVGSLVTEYGIPARKVYATIKRLKNEFTTVKEIAKAIRDGRALAFTDPEVAELLWAFIGVDQVRDACFS